MVRFTTFLLFSFLIHSNAYGVESRPVVIELFTSQGCSSCPPAERFLNKLLKEDNGKGEILPLAFHVDYWDNLGWKDPFSSHKNTERQKKYSKKSSSGSIYTPQIIIDGKYAMVGNNIREIRRSIKKAKSEKKHPTPIIFAASGGNEVEIIVNKHRVENNYSASSPAYIWLFAIKSKTKTKITRGENRGKTMVGRNIVYNSQLLGIWNGGMTSYSINLKNYPQSDMLAVVMQEKNNDSSLGAVKGVKLYHFKKK